MSQRITLKSTHLESTSIAIFESGIRNRSSASNSRHLDGVLSTSLAREGIPMEYRKRFRQQEAQKTAEERSGETRSSQQVLESRAHGRDLPSARSSALLRFLSFIRTTTTSLEHDDVKRLRANSAPILKFFWNLVGRVLGAAPFTCHSTGEPYKSASFFVHISSRKKCKAYSCGLAVLSSIFIILCYQQFNQRSIISLQTKLCN